MKGLEVREVRLSNVLADEDLRLEGKYYNKNRFHVNCAKGAIIEDFSQYGTSKELNEDNKGYPVLRLNEFDTFFISKPAKNCNLLDSDTYESLRLKKDDVLICRTNGNPKFVGKAAIVPRDYDFAFASYLFRVRTKPNLINAATLVTFLNSKYGRLEIEKFSMISNQANFSPAKFRKISIPLFSKQFNIQIEEIIYQAFAQSEKSKAHYSKAEDILLQKLGLKGWQPNNNPVNIKQLKDSFLKSGRLDAEYYQPKYDEIETNVRDYKNGYKQVKDYFVQNKDVSDFSRPEYYYIEIGDVNINNGMAECNLLPTEDLPDNAKRVLCKNDLLVSKVRPYRGAVTIVNEEYDNLIGSGAFTVLREKGLYKKEVLQVLLRTPLYKEWLCKWSVGSSYPVIKDEDVLNLPIPNIPEKTQQAIADHVQKSVSLRQQAKQLLEDAKHMVEQEIEKQ